MRASLTKSTSLVLAAAASAVLLFAAPFDAMARGNGSAGGAAAGAAVSAGPAVVNASVIIPTLRPPIPGRIVVVINEPHRGGCYVQAREIEMELTDVEIDSFLNTCLASQ